MLETRLSINLVNRSRPGARPPGEDQEFVERVCVLGTLHRDWIIRVRIDPGGPVTELPGGVVSPTFDARIAEHCTRMVAAEADTGGGSPCRGGDISDCSGERYNCISGSELPVAAVPPTCNLATAKHCTRM